MSIKNWEGRYIVASGGVLVLAPSRRPWTVSVMLDGAGSYTIEITATPTNLINENTGAGAYWQTLDSGTTNDQIPCDYAVTAIRVTLTGTSGSVELAS
jgi:hypothetical protein